MISLLLDQSPALATLVFLVACSAFFSGAETAMFSLSRHERHRMALRPTRSERYILALLGDPEGLLSTILFGNMVVNVTFYAISVLVATRMAKGGHTVAAGVIGVAALLVVIVFGEVSPKGIAVGHPLGFAHWVAPVLYAVHRLLRPISRVLRWFARTFSGAVVDWLPRHPYVTQDELKMLVGMAEHHKVLDGHTRGMIEQVVEIADIRVNEAMTPRVDMPMFRLGDTRDAFTDLVQRTHEDRIPVYEDSRDKVTGYMVSRDVFLNSDIELRTLVRPMRFVPETQTIERLLRQFRQTRDPIAVVVDEYGGTAGLVTMEHLLEEIVGEIRDEFEEAETPVRQIDDDTYLLSGNVSTHEWRDLLGVGFDPPGIETVAGFVIFLMGRIPAKGDAVTWRGLEFTVDAMSGRRVTEVRVRRLYDEEGNHCD